MAAGKKLSVTTPYGTFTRTTDHVYTHVVVTCGFNLEALRAKIAEAEKRFAKRETETLREWIVYLRRQLVWSEEVQAAGTGAAEQWSHSLLNAQKAASSLRGGRRGLNVVGIFPVDVAE